MNTFELRRRLREAAAQTEGRFALTLNEGTDNDAILTHWVRPHAYAFEQCHAIAKGCEVDCLEELERYVASYHKRRVMVDSDLYIPVRNPQPMASAAE